MNKKQTIEALEKLGLREDLDYHIENILKVETYFEARAINIVSESNYEADNYDAWDKASIEDEMHKETSIVGFQLLDTENLEKITFDELTKDINPMIPNGVNNCAICGKPLVNRGKFDQRRVDGKLRCFDHIGQEIPEGKDT